MNGFIKKGVGTICLTAGLSLVSGCYGYRNLVDPCYPERYESISRKEVCAAFVPQVQNGRVLDQTVWNYYFENGSDKLNSTGQAQLAYVARRRPSPDLVVYLQTAQDLGYDPAAPEKFVEGRRTLDGKRAQAVQKYLAAITADRPAAFEVVVHDPAEAGLDLELTNNVLNARATSFTTVGTQVLNTSPGRFPGTAGGVAASSLGGGNR